MLDYVGEYEGTKERISKAFTIKEHFLVRGLTYLFGCLCTFFVIYIYIYFCGARKRPKHLQALFSRVVEMNQCKSIYVTIKHLRMCVGIFA